MSWIQKLYETYEENKQLAGVIKGEDAPVLLPICHTTQKAQITVVIDGEGNYLRASIIPAADSQTIIPCTESSSSRAGVKPVNHPLCDKLQYVAGDFNLHGGTVTSGFKKNPGEPYERYCQDLKQWVESPATHKKVAAIYHYVKKRTLVSDLISSQCLWTDEGGQLLVEWPKDDKDNMPEIFRVLSPTAVQSDAFVRWAVEIPGNPQREVWTDITLYDAWISYYISMQSFKGLCYVTGQDSELASSHPAKLRNQGDKAKLISANDNSGYTFRGRFHDGDQTAGVSFEVTQKAHNALRWLIERQGVRNGSLALVTWAQKGEVVPDPMADYFGLSSRGDVSDDGGQRTAYTAEEFFEALKQCLYGYRKRLAHTKEVMIIMLDAATTGRLSIRLYRELVPEDFIQRIENWHRTAAWVHTYRNPKWSKEVKESAPKRYVSAPSPFDIAEAAYGRRLDETLQNKTVERVLRCQLDGVPLPLDLVETTLRRASSPLGMERWEWEKTLTIACAMYRKHCEREGYALALEENRKTRDYLYGRLLALADNLEEWALKEGGEQRQTNALRLMQRFSERPFSTWRSIELSLHPYKARLGAKGKGLINRMTEVMALFDADDFISDKKLTGEFLLGYHCQKRALWKNTEEQQQQDEPQGQSQDQPIEGTEGGE
ncbi:type I-C CRISPR-associated protein Cas8c/Csd1 [Anoxynatronum sibiricum]|uniref:Type I-C CRISPR-associated protein Cas8c/Csd1 n=1 Tax=Anoxynatronum sibiricum TaxID=210623 RepID=A0ABU9VUT9_9CLOT